jgi:hypothetical protein
MVAGMLRHLRSLRTMQRDAGWINTLLAEAENERMHLLTFLELRKPGMLFRGAVLVAQVRRVCVCGGGGGGTREEGIMIVQGMQVWVWVCVCVVGGRGVGEVEVS